MAQVAVVRVCVVVCAWGGERGGGRAPGWTKAQRVMLGAERRAERAHGDRKTCILHEASIVILVHMHTYVRVFICVSLSANRVLLTPEHNGNAGAT